MEKRKSYYVSRKNFLTWLSVVMALCSAVTCIVLRCGKDAAGSAVVSQIVLPVLAACLFISIVLRKGTSRLYRVSIPVALFAISVFCEAYTLGLWHRLLVWCLCIAFALAFHLSISGKIHGKLDMVVMFFFEVFLIVLRVFVEDIYIQNFHTAEEWLTDAPLLSALLAALFLCLALQRYTDGKYHPTWGDRNDGRMVRSLDPMTYVGVYIMPERNEANNLFIDTFDLTEIDKYIHQKRREDMPHLTFTEIFLAAYCRMIAQYPALNRFINGQHIYSRDGDIIFNMMVKREMTTTGQETSVKLHLKPSDTLYEVSAKLDQAIREAKTPEESGFDKIAAIFNMIPGLFLKFAVWFLKLLDYFGLLPLALTELSPFHGSVFFTSMASLGIPAIYHHLYNFGNLPVFIALGRKYKKNILNSDGTIEERKMMDITVDCDERICDGFYYATCFKAIKRLVSHPRLLEVPPETVVPDAD